MTINIGHIVGMALISAGLTLCEENERNDKLVKEQEETAQWERRKQAVFNTIARALYTDHNNRFVSNISKARTAAHLRNSAIEYCERRADSLMRCVEKHAVDFERYGS